MNDKLLLSFLRAPYQEIVNNYKIELLIDKETATVAAKFGNYYHRVHITSSNITEALEDAVAYIYSEIHVAEYYQPIIIINGELK